MYELDQEAWDRWKAFRKAIKKPIREVSENAAKLKLARFGPNQAAVVDQSVANGWQGLFEVKVVKGEKPVKSEKQIEADRQVMAEVNARCERYWDNLEPTAINRLKLCEALWARYTVNPDPDTPERLKWLRDVIALHLREANAKDVLCEPGLSTMVFVFFGERGFNRLKERARAETVNG